MEIPSPKELDAQSIVYISEWVDVGSQRWRQIDDMPDLTRDWIKMLTKEPAYLHTDTLGRLWAKGKDGIWFPFHTECCGRLYGFRIAKKALN